MIGFFRIVKSVRFLPIVELVILSGNVAMILCIIRHKTLSMEIVLYPL